MLSAGGAVLAATAGVLGGDLNALVPSAPPALLAPISEDGRVGWTCAAERAARARSAHEAELPAPNADVPRPLLPLVLLLGLLPLAAQAQTYGLPTPSRARPIPPRCAGSPASARSTSASGAGWTPRRAAPGTPPRGVPARGRARPARAQGLDRALRLGPGAGPRRPARRGDGPARRGAAARPRLRRRGRQPDLAGARSGRRPARPRRRRPLRPHRPRRRARSLRAARWPRCAAATWASRGASSAPCWAATRPTRWRTTTSAWSSCAAATSRPRRPSSARGRARAGLRPGPLRAGRGADPGRAARRRRARARPDPGRRGRSDPARAGRRAAGGAALMRVLVVEDHLEIARGIAPC